MDVDVVVDLLAQSAFVTMGTLTRLAAENELSLTQLRVLAILRDRRLRMSDLGTYLGLEKSTLTGLISRAETRGLLRRVPSETDRRAVEVALTESGHHLAAQLERALHDQLGPSVERLTEPERVRLHGLLATVLKVS